ncbi:MCE family protein [Rhodococcus oxybenzonivorans]|jgi:phospholipid/cholesterol/gamma-HCH transport system substrate-binding protein|uniref:MCE family protein n=1 Tax=Rhodococcus TaxID=1827 RepID=UPI00131F6426|nr:MULTISPECIES: MCE family protein [Rhodococcus]MDV7354225.1 MCE family protein [Rhodococcus oxybenzonivorans]QHE67535.1 MCE-family protein Mce1D [Rhodococcus sp. WAY2]
MTHTEETGARKKWWIRGAIAGVVVALIVGGLVVILPRLFENTITAYFPTTTGLYSGDDVRVLGVKVGTVGEIEPGPDFAKVTMSVDKSVDIPADAKAIIVAPSLVSGRFVQLTPVYAGGPTMQDGADIPVERTAVPVEWDEIKSELNKLSEALGPQGADPQGSLGTFIDTAANNLDGNGESLRNTLRELSETMRTLSDGRTDLFSTIRNLQTFVAALSSSNEQIVQFEGRLASVSNLLATNSDELGTALVDLDLALGDVNRFVVENRAALTEQVGRLADATQVLADKRPQLEQTLHVAPTALANFSNIYKPAQGSLVGAVAFANFGNPVNFMCGAIQSLQANDSQRSADLCTQYLSPVLNSLTMNYLPILSNPTTGVNAFPDQLQYSPPSLAGSVPPRSAPPATGALAGIPTVAVPRDLNDLLQPGGGR